jgi:hypothetical protein
VTDKIDIWPKDEAFRQLLEAILVFKDIHGSYNTTTFLQQEITREVVVREYRASRKEVLAAAEVALQLGEQLSVSTDALEFYADGDNYKSRNGQPSAVAKDKGLTARNALLMISGTEVEVDDDEEPE